ncbi:rod shape-determining protein [Paenibacillus sp. Y412MC10]|uniref:Ppx/GppA phosphatase family protein n=1 Tax=Geobacillus sp. (strain Y412MC10) TaxID=481743 RepID=UPI0016433660|nr:rod shape-determining protein [Paenibacillus sp. Y412MC10]
MNRLIAAIVDVGSNTIRLTVYQYEGQDTQVLFHRKTMAGLVHYIDKKRMSDAGIRVVCQTLNDYMSMLKQLPVIPDSIHVFATAAIRNIANTRQVVDAIRESAGIEVEVISGDEEARLSYVGAMHSVELEEGVLVDIGGGSSEIAVFQNKEICYSDSLPIGCLNAYEKCVEKIIPSEKERQAIAELVQKHLQAMSIPELGPLPICGVGGTIRASFKLKGVLGETDHANQMSIEELQGMIRRFKNHKKKHIAPILVKTPDRIHTLIPGMILLNEIARFFQSEVVHISRFGVREGFLYDRLAKGSEEK